MAIIILVVFYISGKLFRKLITLKVVTQREWRESAYFAALLLFQQAEVNAFKEVRRRLDPKTCSVFTKKPRYCWRLMNDSKYWINKTFKLRIMYALNLHF